MNIPAAAIFLVLFYVLLFVASSLSIVSQILLGVAVNRDAIALGLPQGKAFAILTAFFGGIPAGIYFVIRSNKIISEGGANFAPSSKMARTSITLYFISIVLLILFLFGFFNALISFMGYAIYM